VRFLAWAHDLVPTEGGRVLLVQPASTLGARDAAPVRARIDAARSLRGLWLDDGTGFDAAVHTVAPLLVRTEDPGAPPPRIRRWRGPEARPAPPAPAPWTRPGPPGAGWTALADLAVGLPATVGSHHAEGPTLAGHLSATADFRDQYYGLVGLVADLGADADLDDLPEGVAPLVTSGLIDPGSCAWGRRPVRLHRRRWDAPAVRLADLADGPLAHWARARRTPKVLVATQTRVLEAVVDETGHWLPSVPVITVTAPPERLWHAAAALCSPTASALAALRSAGTARSPGALKLRAAQVPELPAPLDDGAWDEGARLLRDAGGAVAAGPVVWRQHMDAFGRAMVAAYGRPGPEADEVLAWWTGRLPDPGR
jgi:hypothetical protein